MAAATAINHTAHRTLEPLRIVSQPTALPSVTAGTTLGQLTSNGLPLPPAPSNLPLRPNVVADNDDTNLMPFYDVLENIMPPTSLQVTNVTQRAQEQQCIFYLSLRQVNQITTSRYKNDATNRVEFPVQVQLRCLKILPGPQTDAFPTGIACRLNKLTATLPPVIPTNKPNAEPQRPGRPINLTPMCRLSPNTPNLLHMGYNYDSTVNYCVEINLVRALSPEDLIDRIRARGVRSDDFTRTMIREMLSPSDTELAVTELAPSLMCPLGKMRMTVPMRSNCCTHVQCFDGYCFLAMNAKKPVWRCPCCDQAATYSMLYIDAYFQDVLATSDSASHDRLQFRSDGSWYAVNSDGTPAAAAAAAAAAGSAGPSGNGDSTTTANDLEQNPVATDASSTAKGSESKTTVDLTISDDEDGDGDSDATMTLHQSHPQPQLRAPPQPLPTPQPQVTAAPAPVVFISLDSSDEEN